MGKLNINIYTDRYKTCKQVICLLKIFYFIALQIWQEHLLNILHLCMNMHFNL